MNFYLGRLAGTAAAVIFSLGIGEASAATLTINSVTGKWTNINPNGGVISGDFTNKISWGQGSGASVPGSSYEFTGFTTPTLIASGSEFKLGEFTHQNFVISGTSLRAADLLVDIDVDGYGIVQSVFKFEHDETNNNVSDLSKCEYPGSVSKCDDLVRATLNIDLTEEFTIDGIDYFFTISGFKVGSTVLTEFLTEEEETNSAGLFGKLIAKEPVNTVPLPAAGWLLLGGVVGLGAVSRRRQRV